MRRRCRNANRCRNAAGDARFLTTVGAKAVAAIATVVLLMGGCGSVGDLDEGRPSGTVTVFAAASLAPVLDALVELFEMSTAARVQVSLAGSSTLRESLLSGAPADVFIPAARTQLDAVAVERPFEDSVVEVAHNSLVLAVPVGNPAEIVGVEDLERTDLLVGLCTRSVPCGNLAWRLLDATDVTAAVDTETTSVSALATKLATGELDVGILYATNARDPAIDIVEWSTGHSTTPQSAWLASYPAGVLADAPNPLAARAFVAMLGSPAAQAIFIEYGFLAP